MEDFESGEADWDPVFNEAPPDAWASFRNVSKFWLLCDELKVQDAALLVLGLEPQVARYKIDRCVDSDLPEGYDALLAALRAAIKGGKVKGIVQPRYEEVYPEGIEEVRDSMDARSSWVSRESLMTWLETSGLTDCIFFRGRLQKTAFSNVSHPRYSAKLAAVVEAWQSFDENSNEAGSVKQRLAKWLRFNADRFGLKNKDGQPAESVIQELATVANWATSGGAPKQPAEEPIPF
ncbi:MAG: hypothetical protein RIB03_05455 [Henriciella sp.]|uniref:hypothetical protein n=1 Tax=Henriciella sp. TaxID=1968823 RepID=UPI0032ECF353